MAFSPSAADTEAKMLFLLTVIKWVSTKKAEAKATDPANQTCKGKEVICRIEPLNATSRLLQLVVISLR